MLRDSARRFLDGRYSVETRRLSSKTDRGFSEDHWRSFAEFGWLGLILPEDVGGFGFSCIETALLMEEFGRALVIEPYVSTAVLCARLLDRCGNADARRQALGELCEGRIRLALAHSETSERYDGRHPRTQARRSDAGFVLAGAKSLVLDAPAADRFIVSARVEGEASYSLFLVDKDAPGITMAAYPLIDDSRAADLRFEDVSVPLCALLEGPALAGFILEEAIDWATLGRSAEALGAMEAVMQMTAEHLKNRSQFGQPLARFQALQHRMAEMFVEVQESRSILYCGLAHTGADAERRTTVISAMKAVVAHAGGIVGGAGIQLHGGMGLTAECAVSHYYKKLLAFEMIHGNVDEHLNRLAGRAIAV